MNLFKRSLMFGLLLALTHSLPGTHLLTAAEGPEEAKPEDAFFAKFHPKKVPTPAGCQLQVGDRLAIAGDSITEQKMYSRIIETYLTVCVPELNVTVRQYGWGGETAPGFLGRMTNDCLRFHPTIATTCYGMNDHGYRAYEPAIGQRYRDFSTAIVRAFKQAGTRVIQGSPGCVGSKWVGTSDASESKNLSLCELRNIGLAIAAEENAGFADVFWPMLNAGFTAQQKFGTNYALAGRDLVHPDWAGHLVMAHAFLKSFGLGGEIGTLTVDLGSAKATASTGHEVSSFGNGELTVVSHRYPFCATGDLDKDNSIRSGMALVGFNSQLNRLLLVVKHGTAQNYQVTWGAASKTYPAEQLAKGVNLADDFAVNPFSEAFGKVDAAVAAKQHYETRQIKQLLHGEEGRVDSDMTAALTEKVRSALAAAITKAFTPVTHTLRITPQ